MHIFGGGYVHGGLGAALEEDQGSYQLCISTRSDWGACTLWASLWLCVSLSLGERQLEELDTRRTRASWLIDKETLGSGMFTKRHFCIRLCISMCMHSCLRGSQWLRIQGSCC